MTGSDDAKKLSDDAKKLLLQDHKYFGELFQNNEKSGEFRVNLFITLVSAGVGGLFALMSKETELSAGELRIVIIVGLFFLLVIGLVTWRRMIKRDISSDLYKSQLDSVRQMFKQSSEKDDSIRNYNPFPTANIRTFGGLGDTVAVINGFLAAGIVAAVVLSMPEMLKMLETLDDGTMLVLAAVLGIIGGGFFARFQISYADRVEKSAKNESPKC